VFVHPHTYLHIPKKKNAVDLHVFIEFLERKKLFTYLMKSGFLNLNLVLVLVTVFVLLLRCQKTKI